jgi:hypothetical protein
VPLNRLSPGQTQTLQTADTFPGESFSGYVRLDASEGLEVRLRHTNQFFMPAGARNNEAGYDLYNEVYNGGFEQLVDGKPQYWIRTSSDQNQLADGTCFATGHYGAYLGGYDNAADILEQGVYIPSSLSSDFTSMM